MGNGQEYGSAMGLRSCRWFLRVLAHLAPADLRRRWFEEWDAEFVAWWREDETGAQERRGHTVLALLLVAAQDTQHIRRLRKTPHQPVSRHETGTSPNGRGPNMIPPFLQDARFSFRNLRKAPVFSLTIIVTLGLGIGISTAMFGVLRSALLSPLPFPDSHELVAGRATMEGRVNPWAAGADFYDYQEQATLLTGLGALMPFAYDRTVTGIGEPEVVPSHTYSPSLLPVLGVTPHLGRTFLPADGLAGAEDVVMISHGYWERRLGSDPDAVGRPITLDGESFTIVGVLPQGFHLLSQADLFLPMRRDRDMATTRDRHNWFLVGRRGPQVSLALAQEQVDAISLRLQEAYPDTNQDKALLLSDLHDVMVEEFRARIWILSGAVALILLLACGNVAGILLARAPARSFEIAIRSALGAGRGRLVRQLLIESGALALLGGVLGVFLALGFQKVILGYMGPDLPGAGVPGLSWPTLITAAGLALVSGLAAGVYPALKAAGGQDGNGLKTGERNQGDGGSGFRSGLVVAQVALSVILLAGSGLLIQSFSQLRAVEPGFDPTSIITAEIQLPGSRYPDAPARTRFYSEFLREARAIPGIESAALVSHLPIGLPRNTYRFRVPGTEGEGIRTFLRPAFPGYFETLDIPLLSGRDFQEADERGTSRVALLSEAAARSFFPDGNPLGRQIEMESFSGPSTMEVVGVVGDVHLTTLDAEPEVAVYLPHAQFAPSAMQAVLRGRSDPLSLVPALREALRAMDPEIPLARISTMEEIIINSVSERRIITFSLSLYALLPLLLAAVGLYAVLAYHVARRRHEIGVRMALGADHGIVGRMVLRQGLALVVMGLAVGLVGTFWATRLLEQLLFGVEPTDPLTLVGVTGFVLGIALVACSVPTWRAITSDPKEALEAF
jgi:putative ABC transport system permease protein